MRKAPTFNALESARQLADQLTILACEVNFVERPADEPLFAQSYLLDGFDSSRAIQLLSNDKPSFYGHKEAVYAAFCGWVFAPLSDGFIFDLVTACVVRLLAEAEEIAEEIPDCALIEQDIFARYFIAGPQFIHQIYGAVCGMQTMNEAPSDNEIQLALLEDYAAMASVLQFMRYCHYWASNPKLNIKPSVRRAISAVKEEIENKNLWASEAAIYDVWSTMKNTIALHYAATTIILGDDVLWDQWSDGKFDYREHMEVVPLLLGRARYVCEHVLAKMHDPELYKINLEPLKDIEPIGFDVYPLDTHELRSATDPNVNKNRLVRRVNATKARLNRNRS